MLSSFKNRFALNNCRKKSNTAGFLLLAETFQLNTLQTTVSGSEK